MSRYYCLIAGLPDITLEDGKLSYTVTNFKTEIYPELSATDRKLIDLFYLKFDNENLLKLLKNKEASIDHRGNYSADEINTLIMAVKEGEEKVDKKYPSYLQEYISDYFKNSSEELFRADDSLTGYYYAYAMGCSNKFVSAWFEFNLNINNILTAMLLRKYKQEVVSAIVGKTEICDLIRSSNARDFGLSGELEYFDQLLRISETEELVEREKKIDMLKWNWMEETSFFNYFTIEKIFVFLLKLEMIERWISLDKEKGKELFKQMINSLKNEVQIPEEFRNK